MRRKTQEELWIKKTAENLVLALERLRRLMEFARMERKVADFLKK